MVCTVDIRQPCLLLYPLNQWEIIEQKYRNCRISIRKNVVYTSTSGYATECELDSAGRILISAPLRQHAKLENPLCWWGN